MTVEWIRDDWMDSRFEIAAGRAFLEFNIRIYFQANDPSAEHGLESEVFPQSDGTEDRVYYTKWTPELLAAWIHRFKRVVESGWNDKLWLVGVPTSRARNPGRHPTGIHPIECRIRTHEVSAAPHAHCVIDLFRLAPGQMFRRSTFQHPSEQFRRSGPPHRGHLDSRDLDPKPTGLHQVPVIHEVGHYLGLLHVGGTDNSAAAYGAPGSYQHTDIMGGGMRFDDWHTYPWRQRLRRYDSARQMQHLGNFTWVGTSRRPRR